MAKLPKVKERSMVMRFDSRARSWLRRKDYPIGSLPNRAKVLELIEEMSGMFFGRTKARWQNAVIFLEKGNAPKSEKPLFRETAAQRMAFYASSEWRAIRFDVLKANDGRCELCGSSKHDGARLHVDHIEPRSKKPELSLAASNLQVLCEDCNLGKSNRDNTDWRKPRWKSPDGLAR